MMAETLLFGAIASLLAAFIALIAMLAISFAEENADNRLETE
jgi:hypothetical protein